MNNSCGLLVNASRSIIYAGSTADFDKLASLNARDMQVEMAEALSEKGII